MAWKTVENNGITLQFPTGGSDTLRVVFDPSGHDIAYVVPEQKDNGNGNAALIAQAPSLLMACRRVWDAVLDAYQHDIPDEVLLAAFDCRRAVVAAVTGKGCDRDPQGWLADRRREQNKAAQARCRARKKAAKEATDGSHPQH
jgi:hypothetical protein